MDPESMTASELVQAKCEQFQHIGLTNCELNWVSDILTTAVGKRSLEENVKMLSLWKTSKIRLLTSPMPIVHYTVTYNINSWDIYQYNIRDYYPVIMSCPDLGQVSKRPVMNYSSDELLHKWKPFRKVPTNEGESWDQSWSNPLSHQESYFDSCNIAERPNKLTILKKVLEGISDDRQILISCKPKNKSQSIRKSNRHSAYRGVSLNGKKWQVMITGSTKKQYYGGISSEREAALMYDKLSILENGLGAKTNFNYRKAELLKMLSEFEVGKTPTCKLLNHKLSSTITSDYAR